MSRIKISLQTSDDKVGHPDFGWITKKRYMEKTLDPETIAEAEDLEYERFLLQNEKTMYRNPRVLEGTIYLDSLER